MTASPDPHVGLPSEETIARAVYGAMSECYGANPKWSDEPTEIKALHRKQARAILSLIRPAFEAQQAKLAQAVEALDDVLAANQRFRDQMPADWEGDPLQDACERARTASAAARGETR